MTKFFYWKHPKTGKIYSDQRLSGFENIPYKTSDGTVCDLLKDYSPPKKEQKSSIGIIDKNAEVFQKDRNFIKKCNPRFIKFNDGHRERYDPSKHN